MKQFKRNLKKQGGFTLIEAGVVIALAAIVIAIAMKTYSSVSSDRKANAEVSSMSALISSAKTFKSGGTYGTGTNLIPILITSNQVPGNIAVVNATQLSNQWGQNITVTGNASQLTVEDDGVPLESCQAVVTGVGNGDSTIQVTVNGTTATETNGTITPGDAQTACGTATPVTVQFITSS